MDDHQQLEAIRAALRGALDTDDPDEREQHLALIRDYAEIALNPAPLQARTRHLRLVAPALSAIAAGLAAIPRQVRHHAAASAATSLIVVGAGTGLVLATETPSITMPGAEPSSSATVAPQPPRRRPTPVAIPAPTTSTTPSSTPVLTVVTAILGGATTHGHGRSHATTKATATARPGRNHTTPPGRRRTPQGPTPTPAASHHAAGIDILLQLDVG